MISKSKKVDIIGLKDIHATLVLRGELFVDYYQKTKIDVYSFNDKKYELSRSIEVVEMKNPWGFASCERYQCLYVSDYKLKVIHKINVKNNWYRNWSVDGYPLGLSVTRSSNVLITLGHVSRAHRFL